MGLEKFVIVFDSPTNAYYAGQNVTGQVQLLLDKPKKIRSLQIKFLGKGEVKWTENEEVRQNDGNTRSENVVYSSDEEYYTFKYNLAGGANSELELPAGQHNYTFAASLPPLLPSSFEGEHGHVRYSVTATLDRPWKFDQHATAVFTVVTPIDLNYNIHAKEPVKMEVEKSFCCCWCKSGPLQLVLAMPHSGWVPGQSIPLTLELDNASNVTVNNLIVNLEKAEVGGCHSNLTVEVPVFVGTVPVYEAPLAGPTDAPSAPPAAPGVDAPIGFNLDGTQSLYPSISTPLLPTQTDVSAAQ
ncbi:arrestin domain-containing protein 17 [Nilaparvata lugens]|uniref:arrestin domain-containing protein 17 n=1 Tax=Nilaparvata lugens TaxID=108931 RepID=UPI00193D255E|nr:arrestin domain-containing protein 17 [Nilaparvata lugens]